MLFRLQTTRYFVCKQQDTSFSSIKLIRIILLQKHVMCNMLEVEREGTKEAVIDITFYRDPYTYRNESFAVAGETEAKRRECEREEVHGSVVRSNDSSSTGAEGRKCVVCLDRGARVAFVPCGHVVTCAVCSSRIKCCCICRRNVERSISLYFS